MGEVVNQQFTAQQEQGVAAPNFLGMGGESQGLFQKDDTKLSAADE